MLKTLLPVLLGVAITLEFATCISVTPAPRVITLGTDPPRIPEQPVNVGDPRGAGQQPQVQPPRFGNEGQGPKEQQTILPVPIIMTGPLQPASEMLPPAEFLEDNDGNFVNVQSKRENQISSQQNGDARFLIPGWTGIIGGGNNGYNYAKPGSCYRPKNNFGSGYYGSSRGKRQVPYENNQIFADTAYNGYQPYQNSNGGGFGGGNSGNYNPGGQQGGNYPGGQHGGNYPGGQQGGNYPGGQHGGNGGSVSYCYRDRDCPGNKKCCDRYCRTPAYVG